MIFRKKERHTCPRREEWGGRIIQGIDSTKQDADTWNNGTCSWCGSLKPDRFMELVRSGASLGPTDKNYKVYVQSAGHAKFYFQHLDADQRTEFIDLVNKHQVIIGYPGHFYVTPFFMKVVEAE